MKSMEIQGPNVTLRILKKNDRIPMIKAASDGELWNLSFTFVPNEQTIDEYINMALNGYVKGTILPFIIN